MSDRAPGRRLYLSAKGAAAVRGRLAAEERPRFDALIAAGEIKVLGAKEVAQAAAEAKGEGES